MEVMLSHTAEVINNGQYVQPIYEGDVSVSEIEAGRQEAVGILAEYNGSKLLVDFARQTLCFSAMDHSAICSSHIVSGHFGHWIAVVVRSDQEEEFRFGEKIAVSRSTDMKVFTAKCDAMQWLFE
jgi:hypothetical protein